MLTDDKRIRGNLCLYVDSQTMTWKRGYLHSQFVLHRSRRGVAKAPECPKFPIIVHRNGTIAGQSRCLMRGIVLFLSILFRVSI